MSFNIERGLFKLDFTDYHAVLGVPLDATANDIRKRYIKISRRLHPDALAAESEANKQRAGQFFAKLVSPAKEQLSGDDSRAEHAALLGRLGKRLAQEREKMDIQGEAAKQLSRSGNLEHDYKTTLQKLADRQYESLDQILEWTAQISELNLVYLLRKSSQGQPASQPQQVAVKSATPASAGTTTPANVKPSTVEKKPEKQEPVSMTEPYRRRAEEYLAKNSIAKAVLELRDALQLEPNNSQCHALMAMAYLRQNQATMAKIHLERALKSNPQEPVALEVKKFLEKSAQKTASKSSAQKKPDNKPSGGLFGLFGSKNQNQKKK